MAGEPLLYVDTSEVRDGALEEVKAAVDELVRFVDENVTTVLAYNVYFSGDGRQMTVTHLHPDATSLEQHMDIGGPAFGRFAGLLRLSSIEVFGEPSERALRQMQAKARTLGSGRVVVHAPHAGFSRLVAAE